MLAEFHKFSYNDNYYILHVKDVKAYQVNHSLFTELSPKYDSSNIELVDVLKSINMIQPDDQILLKEEKLDIKPPPISSITINIAQSCNMKCVYCYGGDGEYGQSGFMKAETAYQAVDFLFDNSEDKKNISIAFFGGEPLLNFDLIKNVVNYSQVKAENQKKEISYGITTNGSFFDKDVNDFLNENKFAVTISFDGERNVQETNRPLKSNESSYDTIRPKIQQFLQSRNGKASARVTLTKYSGDIDKIRNELKNLGFKKITCVPVTSSDTQHYSLGEKEFMDIIIDIENNAKEMISLIKKRQKINRGTLENYVNLLVKRTKKEFFCGAAKGLVAISSNGEIYPCHRFVGNKEYSLENSKNIKTEENRKPFFYKQIVKSKPCTQCWAKYFCGGGCYYDNIDYSNDLFKPNESFCSIVKKNIEMAIYVYGSLTKEERALYFGDSK